MTVLESTHPTPSRLDDVLDAISALGPRHAIDWEIKKLRDYRGALLALAPYRVGDRAVLTDPPKIERSSGWWHSRHFLVGGATCTICEIDWRVPPDEPDPAKGYFVVAATFDGESRMGPYDEENKKLPNGQLREIFTAADRRHTYQMAARRFVKAPA